MMGIFIFSLMALIVLGRVLHGRGGEKWWQSKWVLFAPSILLATLGGVIAVGVSGIACGVLVALGIVLFFSGAVADNTLNYMYRRVHSDIRNIVISVSWRIALCCVLILAVSGFSSLWMALLCVPMLASVYPLIHVAKENRHITGRMDDGNHRKNVEIAEGFMGAVNIAALIVVWIGVL